MASQNYFQKKTLIIYRRVKKLHNQDLSQSSESTQHPEPAFIVGEGPRQDAQANVNTVGAWSNPTESKTNIFLEHAGELCVSLH